MTATSTDAALAYVDRQVFEQLATRHTARRPRIALYSHDTMGLGHVRRNLLVADAIGRAVDGELDTLLITGARQARLTDLPRGVDCLDLPALRKHADGSYGPRSFGMTTDSLIELRSTTICAALSAFEPDLFIVDNVPRGAVGELEPALEALCRNPRTQCVLGLRDIADEPASARLEWESANNVAALTRYFDHVWIYGDSAVYDRARTDGLPASVRAKARFTGYLDQTRRARPVDADFPAWLNKNVRGLAPDRDFALCLIGGGQDGSRLAETFADADFGDGRAGVLLAGPFLPAGPLARLRERANAREDLHVVEFGGEPAPLIAHAERVVSMGGYNSMCELISYSKHALVVPRTQPRAEQLIRAERFLEIGAIDGVMLPSNLSSGALSDWLSRPRPNRLDTRKCVDLFGLDVITELARELIAPPLAAAGPSPTAFRLVREGSRS